MTILDREMEEFGDGESLDWSDQGISFSELMEIASRVEQRRHCKVVCLLDEIECLEGYFENGLTALQQLADAGVVRLIVGALGLRKLLSDSTSPIFGRFIEQKLGCLERNAAIELITRPVKDIVSYEPKAIDEILRFVGTHPQLVQMLCSSVVTTLNHEGSTKATGKNVRRAYPKFIETGYAMFTYLSRVLDPLCLDLLGAFVHIQSQAAQATLGKDEFVQYVIKRDGAPLETVDLHDRVEKAIEALCDQEIMESLDDQYRLKAQCYIDSLTHPYLEVRQPNPSLVVPS